MAEHPSIGDIHQNLEACERELVQLEIKYGLQYDEFKRRLAAGELDDAFEYLLNISGRSRS